MAVFICGRRTTSHSQTLIGSCNYALWLHSSMNLTSLLTRQTKKWRTRPKPSDSDPSHWFEHEKKLRLSDAEHANASLGDWRIYVVANSGLRRRNSEEENQVHSQNPLLFIYLFSSHCRLSLPSATKPHEIEFETKCDTAFRMAVRSCVCKSSSIGTLYCSNTNMWPRQTHKWTFKENLF